MKLVRKLLANTLAAFLAAGFLVAAPTSISTSASAETIISQLGLDIDGAAGDRIGSSVSLSSDGTRVAIGAIRGDVGDIAAGTVRIYDWNGSSWAQVGSDIDGEADVDLSGYAVSLSSDGSRVAIGASYNDGNGDTAGHVRIFDYNGTAWAQVGSDIDGEAAGDLLGYKVSLSSDGNRVAIGARQDSAVDNMRGSARVYDWNGNAWVKLGSNINGEAETDFFGHAVSLSSDGTVVAVGTPYNDGNGGYAGHTRMFSLAAAAPAPAPAPAPYSGPLPTAASPGAGSAGEQITITGIRLSTITSVQIDGVAAAIVSVEKTSLVFTLPEGLEAGTKSIVLNSSYGKLTFQAGFEYKVAAPVAVVEPEADSATVNAGSFDGYVAVYAKGHEGKTLSWKIAGKWFKTEITSNYQVFQRKTAAIGKDVKVDLYIDGKSQLSKLVRTR